MRKENELTYSIQLVIDKIKNGESLNSLDKAVLLTEGYKCALWGRRIHFCTEEKCHLKDTCIFMNGTPEDYTNYVLTEFIIK